MSSPESLRHPATRDGTCHGRCALAIVFKTPRHGQVKTLLVPALTPEAAADLSRSMIRDTADNIAAACEYCDAAGVAVYTPPGSEAEVDALVPGGFLRVAQRGGSFGERLANAASDLFAAGFRAVCLIDSDSPTLPTRRLVEAVSHLEHAPSGLVLVGADDGGYCLIGMSAPEFRVFDQIDWSTPRVYAQTIRRAGEAGLGVVELPAWYDVDDRSSLDRLRRELLAPDDDREGGYAAPHTRAFLASMADRRHERGWRVGVEADAG